MQFQKFIAPGLTAAITAGAVVAGWSLYPTYLARDSYFRVSRNCELAADVQTAVDGEPIHHVADTLNFAAAYQERGGAYKKLMVTTHTERGDVVSMTFQSFWMCPEDY